jgi:NADPH:quinone reductase-like Zn-dependent oxidoreductase
MNQTLRVYEKAADINQLTLHLHPAEVRKPGSGECLIEIKSAGVNPSDVKAALGAMPHAVWPRTPGRDYAGVVIDGPADLIRKEVWGSGGEFGIRRNGTHGKYLLCPVSAVRQKPSTMSLIEASAIGVPFITAFEGLRRAGHPKSGDVVLVFGANGKVGQATIQLATRAGAKVFGVERTNEAYRGHASGPVRMISASEEDVQEVVRGETGGHGADIVYNTVGSPYFDAANKSLATGGRQIFISTIDRAVPFDIFTFYRGQHTFVGIDTLALDSTAGAAILDELMLGFSDGSLKPFPVPSNAIYPLERAADAYRAVLAGSIDRVVLLP